MVNGRSSHYRASVQTRNPFIYCGTESEKPRDITTRQEKDANAEINQQS
jgi:hypothetical protein